MEKRKLVGVWILSIFLVGIFIVFIPKNNKNVEGKIGVTCSEIDRAIVNDDGFVSMNLLPKGKLQRMQIKATSLLQDIQKKLSASGGSTDKSSLKILVNRVNAPQHVSDKLVKLILEAKYTSGFLNNPHEGWSFGPREGVTILTLLFENGQEKYDITFDPESILISYNEKSGCTIRSNYPSTTYQFFYASDNYKENYKDFLRENKIDINMPIPRVQ